MQDVMKYESHHSTLDITNRVYAPQHRGCVNIYRKTREEPLFHTKYL